jgi:hypothetical protein
MGFFWAADRVASISVTSFGWWTAVLRLTFRRRAGKVSLDLSGDNSPLFCFVLSCPTWQDIPSLFTKKIQFSNFKESNNINFD